MTWRKREIMEMAQEAGMNVVDDQYSLLPFLAAFAKLVREDEREACIEAVEKSRVIEFVVYPKDHLISRNDVPRCYAFQHARSMEAIRARGEQA
jgi:hypothetical protein